jgi:hypothetical protein
MSKQPWMRGKKFRIRYRTPTQRYDREMVAVYLGMPSHRDVRVAPGRRQREFSGRPQFGTTFLEMGWIISNELVDDSIECYVDRRAPAIES